MKRSALWLGLPVAVILAACAGEAADDEFELPETTELSPGAEQPGMPEPAPPMEPATAMAETAQLEALEGSGVTGDVSVTDRGAQTEVTVRLTGTPANSTHPGHIHSGTCEEIGSVVQPLQEISTDASGAGTMTATVDVAPMTAMDGQHIVVYHGEGGTPVTCAAIPTHTM